MPGIPRRRLALVAGLSLGHLILSWGLFMVGFGLGMAAFEGEGTGAEAKVVGAVANVLFLPLAYPVLNHPGVGRFFPGLAGWIPLILNSVAWGCLSAYVISRMARRTRHRTEQGQASP